MLEQGRSWPIVTKWLINMGYQTQFEASQQIVVQVGKALLGRLASVSLEIQEKTGFQDLVTNEDIRVQNELMEYLEALLPEAQMIAEEKANQAVQGLTWLLDPIDGTVNFITMQRNFAISLALYDGKLPIFGIVYDVAQDELFVAYHGQGAFCNGKPIQVYAPTHLKGCLFNAGLSSINAMSKRLDRPFHLVSTQMRGHRASGSAALALCHIARGDEQLYLSSKLWPWDYAGAGVVLQEAGGAIAVVFEEDSFLQLKPTAMLAGASADLIRQLKGYMFEA